MIRVSSVMMLFFIKRSFLTQYPQGYLPPTPGFFLEFCISDFKLKYLIHFELILQKVRDINVSSFFRRQKSSLDRPFFFSTYFLSLSKIKRTKLVITCAGPLLYSIDWVVYFYAFTTVTVVTTIVLEHNLRLGMIIPPILFYLLRIALAIHALLSFHMNSCIFFPNL